MAGLQSGGQSLIPVRNSATIYVFAAAAAAIYSTHNSV
jgi:hypothetical protein